MKLKAYINLGLWAVSAAALVAAGWLRHLDSVRRSDLLAAERARRIGILAVQRLRQKNNILEKNIADLRAQSDAAKPRSAVTARELLARSAKQMKDMERARVLLNDPELLRLNKVWAMASAHLQYSALYHQLNLAPDRANALEALRAERQARLEDVRVAAYSAKGGMSNPDIQALLASDQRDLENQERELLGTEAFVQLQQFEHAAPERAVVEDASVALMSSSAPLTRDQKTALVGLLTTARTNSTDDAPMQQSYDWARIRSEASNFLTAPQLEELGSSVAASQYHKLTREYGNMLSDWVAKNSPRASP